MNDQAMHGLRELARLFGVQLEYEDMAGRRHVVAPEALLGILRALGAPVEGPSDIPGAVRERRHALSSRPLEPVVVAWDGEAASVPIRLSHSDSSPVSCRLILESGEETTWDVDPSRLETTAEAESEGLRFSTKHVRIPVSLPSGYHRLRLAIGPDERESLVIAAPRKAFGRVDQRLWGLFCPLHALHRRSSWGAGDFSDLGALIEWVAGLGGSLVATLPMLASAIDEDNPSLSPYSPISRLFWNDFYVDPLRIPELSTCESARALLESPELQAELESLRAAPLVDYGRQMSIKRRVLQRLAEHFFEREAESSVDFRRFLADHPSVDQYAHFMAAGERYGRNPQSWPGPSRGPVRGLPEVDHAAVRYHLFAQWQADRQLRALAQAAHARGLTWYVDFPVGVDANSYDVWRHPESFARAATVGAPPDPTYVRGQDWGFPPPHPERQREQGYRYLIESLRCHFRYADALRIDHVMGLHRLYWIPDGLDARSGAFVRYPSDEIYAILSVESHRRGAWLVGENLGTVPNEVQESLARHSVRGMYVIQYELTRPLAGRMTSLAAVPSLSVASVNTHDMPPFAGFWNGRDIDDRLDLGLLDHAGAARAHEERADQRQTLLAFLRERGLLADDEEAPHAVLEACLAHLAASPAHVAVLNLEDLWLEELPQNVPNTASERPNWRRKHQLAFDDFHNDPAVVEILKHVAKLREAPSPPHEPLA